MKMWDIFTICRMNETEKCAILEVVEGRSLRYMPKTELLDLPTPLTTLYASTRLEMDLPALLEEGANIFDELHLTPEQVRVENSF